MDIKEALKLFGINDIAEETEESLKKKYKRLMIKYHPDNNNGDANKAKDIVEANTLLKELIISFAKYKALNSSRDTKTFYIVIPLDKLIELYSDKGVEVGNNTDKITIYRGDLNKYNVAILSDVSITHNGMSTNFNSIQHWEISDNYEINCSIIVDNLCNSEKVKIRINGIDKEIEFTNQSIKYRFTLSYNINVNIVITKKLRIDNENK